MGCHSPAAQRVEMAALHRVAQFCLVTPLHDGINLVAKEFVASRVEGAGCLIAP